MICLTKQMRTHLRALVPEVEDAEELNANLQAQIQVYSDSDFFHKEVYDSDPANPGK